jgi:hypothetical protein
MSIKTKLHAQTGLALLLALAVLFAAATIANAQAAPSRPTPSDLPAPTREPTPPIPLPPSPTPPNLMPLGDLRGNPSTSSQLAYNPQADAISESLQQGGPSAGPKPVGSTPELAPVAVPKPSPTPPAPPKQYQ